MSHDGNGDMERHIGNACRRYMNLRDAEGKRVWLIQKERPDSPHKIDGAMAAVLAWEARNDAIAAGVTGTRPPVLSISSGEGASREDSKGVPEFSAIRRAEF